MSEGAGDSITIHFSLTSSPSTPRITKTIRKEAKASELRVVAADATQIPIASLKLIYRGRIIQDDDKVISGYCVENDCVIHCLGKPVVVEPSVGTASSTASVPVTSTASTPSVETTSTTNTSGSGASTSFSVEAALQNLKSKNEAGTYSTALTTLGKVVSNIITNPNEEKYRKVKQSNAAFARRLGKVQGGRDAMLAVGFVSEIPEGTDEPHFVLKPNADAWNHLLQSKTKIDAEIEQNKRNQYVPPAMPTSPSTPFMPSSGAFGGAGNIPGMPPMTPAMQQQMSSLMSNPEMLRNMMNNPMIQQAMSDPNIINQMTEGMDPMMRQRMQQMMSDPMMRQRMQQMMSDPAMMQMMMNQMSNRSGMGSGSITGTAQTQTTPQSDPAAFARMMQGFSQMQNASNSNSSQQQGTSNSATGSNNNSSSERDMTEEEMIAEAIARSLRDP